MKIKNALLFAVVCSVAAISSIGLVAKFYLKKPTSEIEYTKYKKSEPRVDKPSVVEPSEEPFWKKEQGYMSLEFYWAIKKEELVSLVEKSEAGTLNKEERERFITAYLENIETDNIKDNPMEFSKEELERLRDAVEKERAIKKGKKWDTEKAYQI